jgi:hypothetical protein
MPLISGTYRKPLIFFVKLLIAAVSIYFIWKKVISRSDFTTMWNESLEKMFVTGWQTVIVICALMLLNWGLESLKWQLLLKKISPVSFLGAVRSVLSGVTVSFFTPNRIGEFAGRVLHLETSVRIRAAIASVIGSMNQLLVTILAGGVGLLFSVPDIVTKTGVNDKVLIISAITTMTLAVLIYFRLPYFAVFLTKLRILPTVKSYIRVLALYPLTYLGKLTVLSALRYMVFTFQYIILLQVFGIELPVTEMIRLIAVIYLVLALVPSVALSELTLRGSVAMYLMVPEAGNSTGVLAASLMLWLINLVIPAVLGSLSALYFRFTR